MTTRTLAIASQKGGVGKTTTCVSVAACAGAAGRRVLVVDVDPQANTSDWLTTAAAPVGVLEVLTGEATIADAAVATTATGVDLVAAGPGLIGAERALGGQPGIEAILAGALRAAGGYDLVMLDCPPTLGLLTVSALVAASEVVVPVTMSGLSLSGLAQLMATVDLVDTRLNPGLHLSAVVPCQYVANENLSREVLAVLVEQFGAKVTPTVRRSVRATEAPGHHQPLNVYAPTEGVTQDYQAVTDALLTEGEK